jgi:hypothetical protein
VEPRYKSLTVSLVPQPRQLPPPAFDKADLQKVFADIIPTYPYRAFEFIYNDRGIQLNNGPEDTVEIRPAMLQVQAKMDDVEVLLSSMAEKKALKILNIASERLHIDGFLQCAIQILAFVDAPDDDATAFMAGRLLHGAEQADVLGEGYFGAGVRFRRLKEDESGEDSLSVEPTVEAHGSKGAALLLHHTIVRAATAGPLGFDQVSTWIEGGFDFVNERAMRLLSEGGDSHGNN